MPKKSQQLIRIEEMLVEARKTQERYKEEYQHALSTLQGAMKEVELLEKLLRDLKPIRKE